MPVGEDLRLGPSFFLPYSPECVEGALAGDDHTAFDVGDEHPHGYALYFFTRRAVKLLEG